MASPLAYTNLPDEGGVTYTNTQPTFEQLDAVSGRGNLMGRGALSALYGVAAGRQANDALSAEFAGDEARKKSALRAHDELVARAAYEAPNQDLRKIGGVGDAVDFVRGAAGNAAVTMIPSIAGAALFRGRGPVGKAAAFGGAYAPAYVMERDEALSSQYQDPEQMKASAEERDLAATAKGGINAALESIVPAGLGGSLLRKPAGSFLGHVGRETVTEGVTEGAQQLVGYGAQKYIDPNKELDPWDVANAAAAGAAGGGGMSAIMRGPSHAAQAVLDSVPTPRMPEIKNPFQRGDAAADDGPVDLPPDTGGGGDAAPADTMLGKVAGLGQAVNDRFGDDIAAAGDKAVKAAGTAKDFVSETVGRMTEAVKTAENPGDFLNKVFGGNIDEEAAADMTGEPNPALKGITFEETEANIARDDAKKAARAARYAEELLNDPATPEQIKQRVAAMGGDYANPGNQAFVARTLVAQRGGEKIAKAVQDLVDLGKSAFAKGSEAAGEGLSAAKKAVGDAATAAQDRIIKKNMQSASPAEQAAFSKVLFDNLTEEAKASTFVRAQLSQAANVLMAFAAKTGDITAKDLPTLTKLSSAMSMFKDPDAMVAQLVEYGAIPRDSDSFLGRVKAIQNARTDIKQPNSFLYTSLTPEAKDLLTGPMLQRLAQFVDEFSLQDTAGKGDQILEGLTQAFGSKENAQAVLDFYAQQNKANVRFDPNEEVRDAGGEVDGEELASWDGAINERDAGKAAFRFKDAKAMRPFFKGSKDISTAQRDGTLGDEGTQKPYGYDQYVAETGGDGEAEVNRLLKDIDSRIAQHEARKGEDRSTLINALKGEKSMVQDAYARGGAEEALSLYEVLRTEAKDQNDLVATDEDLAKYSFKKGASRVTFKRTDGTKLMLSAESMWKTFGDKTKGDTTGVEEGDTARARRLFNEAVASVLARPDIESLETSLSGLKLDEMGTEAEPKIDPVLREKIAHELNKASGSLSEIKAGLQRMFKGYSAALSQGDLGEQAVYTLEDHLRTRIDQAAKAVDAATTAPQRAVLRERHLLYERALERVLEMKQNFLDDGVGGNGNTDGLDPPIFSRLRKEMDTSKGVRFAEEDTGAAVGTGGAVKKKKSPEPAAVQTGAKKGVAELPPVNKEVADALRNVLGKYAEEGSQVAQLDKASYEQWRTKTVKAMVAGQDSEKNYMLVAMLDRFVHLYNADTGQYGDLAKEKRSRFWSESTEGKVHAALDKIAAKKKNPAASSRETAKKVDDVQAVAPDEPTALPPVDAGVADALRPVLGKYAEGGSQIAQLPRAQYEVWRKQAVKDMIRGVDSERNYMLVAMVDKFVHLYDANSGRTESLDKARSGRFWAESTEGKVRAALDKLAGKKKDPAASSREAAKKIDDPQALSPDAITALHDVVVKENWSRLDTPAKVLRFAAMAAKAREQLNKTPELERTDVQDELRFKLNDMFNQDKGAAFDWESLWDGLDPTDAQKAQLEDLIRPKAEPGTARQSTMKPKRGRPGKIDRQAILDEIARIRGKDVKVAFAKFADIGASGEFSMNKDKTQRLIKIAINSLNPMSVAWHESLHDFMAMLGGSQAERKLKADLLDAAEAPQVMFKLRELLKDHPDALKQIETDREERLAYMYQFWAEGALPLGQTGTNIFSRAVTFFREMLGVLSQDQKIDQLFTALHTGKFSEPSLVAAVLEDLKAKTLSDKAREVSGPIGDAAEAMFTGATDRLRNTNVDALTELADLFHREPGRENSGELPFLQRRAQQVGKRLNKLQDILKGTTSEERRRALENMQAMKPASTPLEKELAAYLKEMRDYMVDRGVKRFDTKTKKWTDLGNVKDYFPRVWDKEAIRNNEAEFINLMEQYIGKAQARETFNALVNGDGSLELAENEHTLGFTPWNPAVLDRQFTFINPSNAAAFAKFQSKDMADIMTSYTQRAVHRAEYAHTFGNDGEVITSKFLEAQKQGATQDELDMARKATMAMEGTLGYDFNPRLKEVMSGIVTYQNIVLLPLSLFSNLIDPLGVAMRSNDMKEAWKAFTYGIKGIADQLRGAGDDAQTEMARTLGLIDEQNMLEAMGHVYNSMHMSRFLKNINSKFFRYNGMEMWNQRMRVAAMMAAQRFILANLGHERYMKELGITEKDVFQLQDGTIALTKDQLLQAGAKKSEVSDIEKRIQAAVFKWVDGAVLRPNAAHRPVWGSDPRYQLIFHLKQFTFSFQNTILRRVGEELKHGNVAPGWILMSYVPFMFLSDVLKGSLTGTLNTTADLYDVASQSIARSGIMGTGVFGADAMGDLERGKLPGTSFLGPAFGHLTTLLSGITGHAGVEQVMDRSVPFAKYI